MRRAAAILIPLVAVSVAAAQQPGVELRIDSQVLEVGEVTDLQLVCVNTAQPGAPKGVVPDGLEVNLANSSPSMNSRTSMINGRTTKRIEYIFSLRLTALRAGTYELGPFTVDAGGKTFETDPVKIQVNDVQEDTRAPGDRFVFVEIEVEPTTLYVTESYTAKMTLGVRKVVINGRTIPLNLLRNVVDIARSQFSVFSTGRPSSDTVTLTDSRGQAHQYELTTVQMTLRAETVGETRVGPVFVSARYPTDVRRGFFGSYEVTRSRKETARAQAVTVTVKGPPEEGRPADYDGAVGKYKMSVDATPKRVEQGKPVTLTITISGSPLESISGPNLATHAELASRFDYTKDELVGDVEGRRKVFRRAIFPRQAGAQTIPPISWSYFDSKLEKYVTLKSPPITLTVDPAVQGTTTFSMTDPATNGSKGAKLTVLTGGIERNYVDTGEVLASHAFVMTPSWIAVLSAPPALWLCVTIGVKRRRRLKGDVALARRRRAQRDAHARLAAAGRRTGEDERRAALAEAVKGYVCDRFNLPPGELTPPEVAATLDAHGVDQELAGNVVSFLDTCNAAQYAPGAMDAASLDRAANDVRTWIRQIERTAR